VAQPLKLSIRLHGGLSPQHCLELATAAEASGFHAVWFAENAFNRGVLPAAAVCVAATRRIGIGIGVLNPYNRHPTLMAMEIGALDELAQGRVRLGIGSGIAAATRRMGLHPDRPVAAVRDAITIVRGMLAGEEVSYTGRAFSAFNVKLEYKAIRPRMPLLMAARGDQALALCGEIADGLIISNMCPAEFTRHAVEVMRRSARDAGREIPVEVVQYIPCVARPDRSEAHRIAKEVLGRLLADYWSLGERVPSAKSALLRAQRLSASDFAATVSALRAGKSAAEMLDDRFLAAFAIAGTAEDCLAQARAYLEAGATELVLSFAGPQPERDMHYLGSALAG
jgi:5,10-methylenetetrahydromethanopterin reductase